MSRLAILVTARGRILGPALFGGALLILLLAALSLFGVCGSDACRQTHRFTTLGLPVAVWGGAFATVLLASLAATSHYGRLFWLNTLLLAAGAGSEVVYLGLQATRTGWCVPCAAVAVVVFALLTLSTGSGLFAVGELGRDGGWGRTFFCCGLKFLLAGGAFLGALLFTALFTAEPPPEKASTLFLGNPQAPVEVYLVTDWFCPACRVVEPGLLQGLPSLAPRARIFFADLAIHPESRNFIPYALRALEREPARYLEARRRLSLLAARSKNPSCADLAQALSGLSQAGCLGAAESWAYLNRAEELATGLKVRMTPTVVVRGEGGREIRLEGVREVSSRAVADAVATLSRRK